MIEKLLNEPGEIYIDGHRIRSKISSGRLVLECPLAEPGEAGDVVRLASLAPGRFLREEAVLSWDASEGAPILWQDIRAGAPEEEKVRFLNRFLASVDWWAARAGEAGGGEVAFPELVIRP